MERIMSNVKLNPLPASEGRLEQMRQARARQSQPDVQQNFAALMLQNRSGSSQASPHMAQFEHLLGDSAGLADVQAMNSLLQLMDGTGNSYSTLDTLRNVINTKSVLNTLPGHFTPGAGISGPGLVEGRINRPPSSHRDKDQVSDPVKQSKAAAVATAPAGTTLGSLAARFESGKDGVAAIGYDRHGGTSYGKFQLSSRAGSMDQFIKFLSKEQPDWGKRLANAGPANTGSRSGSMPNTWKEIAAENPARFEELQTRFVHNSHFQPAVAEVAKRTGLDFDSMSPAMREVLWSTAVQHGVNGAARLFSRAVNQLNNEGVETNAEQNYEKALITKVYALRSGQFGSSEQRVQTAVKSRLVEERDLALALVDLYQNA